MFLTFTLVTRSPSISPSLPSHNSRIHPTQFTCSQRHIHLSPLFSHSPTLFLTLTRDRDRDEDDERDERGGGDKDKDAAKSSKDEEDSAAPVSQQAFSLIPHSLSTVSHRGYYYSHQQMVWCSFTISFVMSHFFSSFHLAFNIVPLPQQTARFLACLTHWCRGVCICVFVLVQAGRGDDEAETEVKESHADDDEGGN